jgi:hypothetical protein
VKPAVVQWIRPGVNGYGVGRVVEAGQWQGEDVLEGDFVAIPPGVTTARAPTRPPVVLPGARRPSALGLTLFAGALALLAMFLAGNRRRPRQ